VVSVTFDLEISGAAQPLKRGPRKPRRKSKGSLFFKSEFEHELMGVFLMQPAELN